MFIKQISVFLENKKGMLYNLTKMLADNQIDIKALSMADTSKFGIIRLIVSDPEGTLDIIKNANFTASVTEVLGVELEDRPGGLAEVLSALKDSDIAVEYLYSFVGTACENAMIIVRVEELEKAHDILRMRGFPIVTEDRV
jgi:hypothetical protein